MVVLIVAARESFKIMKTDSASVLSTSGEKFTVAAVAFSMDEEVDAASDKAMASSKFSLF